MAGPTAGVDLRRTLSNDELAQVWSTIDSISFQRLRDDFWVGDTVPIGGNYTGEGQPFAFCLSQPSESFDEDDAGRYERLIEGTFGFEPVQSVDWVAM